MKDAFYQVASSGWKLSQ
uniref:Uncharacterized protein n=1 Tax=Arundo donax TaxID=35708 RepID=A0A0A9A5Q0_ARUDO